jgi:hypothetical protein
MEVLVQESVADLVRPIELFGGQLSAIRIALTLLRHGC